MSELFGVHTQLILTKLIDPDDWDKMSIFNVNRHFKTLILVVIYDMF